MSSKKPLSARAAEQDLCAHPWRGGGSSSGSAMGLRSPPKREPLASRAVTRGEATAVVVVVTLSTLVPSIVPLLSVQGGRMMGNGGEGAF